jgi:hypothetical protein
MEDVETDCALEAIWDVKNGSDAVNRVRNGDFDGENI